MFLDVGNEEGRVGYLYGLEEVSLDDFSKLIKEA